MALTARESELAAAIGFDEHVCELLKQRTGHTFDRLIEFNEQYEQQDAEGLSIAVERQDVEPCLVKLQSELTDHGYRAFWSEVYESNGAKTSDEIAVLKTVDQYSIIQLRRSNGGNYGVSTDDVIKRLKEWENRCQFQIVGAGGDWVAVQFESLPENTCAFAEEIYEFCPDTVEQGVGLTNECDDPETFEAARQLCPEVSATMQQKLDEQQAEYQQMDMPPQLREMFNSDAGGLTTPTDMGIRLLAYHLKQSNQLFLWWD